MSNEDRPQGVEEQAKPQRESVMNPTTMRLIIGTGIVVILLTLTAFAGTVRTEAAKKEALLLDTAALAASMKFPLMEANSIRTNAGRERLGPMLEEIREAGGFTALVLADEAGETVATTRSGSPVSYEFDKEPWVGRESGGLHASAPIKVGTNTIGYLYVETDR